MGVIRMILIIIGVMVALRFIGQLMVAKRNIDEQNKLRADQDALQRQKEYTEKNKGKTNLSSRQSPSEPFEDVDYEEVDK